jgi:hypothetical protein
LHVVVDQFDITQQHIFLALQLAFTTTYQLERTYVTSDS